MYVLLKGTFSDATATVRGWDSSGTGDGDPLVGFLCTIASHAYVAAVEQRRVDRVFGVTIPVPVLYFSPSGGCHSRTTKRVPLPVDTLCIHILFSGRSHNARHSSDATEGRRSIVC